MAGKTRCMEGWGLALLALPVLLSVGCESRELRQARRVQQLVQRMSTECREAAERSSLGALSRDDIEMLRRAFGRTAFEEGTPLGQDFPDGVEALMKDVETNLAKEPLDYQFPPKAARRVRRVAQWWLFVRQHLEGQRQRLIQASTDPETAKRIDPVRLAAILTVVSESVHEVEGMETITTRCLREIENVLARG